jgi:GntP family gluconate:H+ symporter
MTRSQAMLIALALGGVAVLVLLVVRVRLNAFAALLAAALLVGIGSGKPMLPMARAFQDGMGATLGATAAVIALGAMLGKLLAESRGAEVLADRLIVVFGRRHVVACVMVLALVVGLTTWFAVGLLLLLPILQTLTRETQRPYFQLALPLLACLSVMHGLMPPHPGPIVAVEALHARTGMVLLWGFALGVPTAVISGPVLSMWAPMRVNVAAPIFEAPPLSKGIRLPDLGLTVFSILLPVMLMLLATLAELTLAPREKLRLAAEFIGNPTIALLIAVIFAMWSLGTRCGFARSQLLKFSEDSVAAVGMAILIVGGGGGFARVLGQAGVADAMGALAGALHLPPLLYGWLVSAFIRVATGSSTVAITAASVLLAPVLAAHPGTNVELAIMSIAFGSLFLSHLNDGGFWIVKECLGLTVRQTLQTWTVMETLMGLVGLGLTLCASALL